MKKMLSIIQKKRLFSMILKCKKMGAICAHLFLCRWLRLKKAAMVIIYNRAFLSALLNVLKYSVAVERVNRRERDAGVIQKNLR